jgi:FkbM family methyltransferase
MTQAAFQRGDWAAVIDAHPLESHDPQEWLRYGVALLQMIEPGGDAGKQQQQAALAFVQAQKEGAPAEAVATHQIQSLMISLGETLLVTGFQQQALEALARGVPGWIPEEQRAGQARLIAGQMLVRAGLWKEAEALHAEAVRAIDPQRLSVERLANELDILRSEGELLSHELSLALSQGSLSAASTPAGVEGRERWQSLSRSQLGQDLWVLEQLNWKQNGYFVEFGATDGVLLSNTWLLEKHFGWQGICAEPNPKLYERLQQNRTCKVSPACVYRSSGECMPFVLADAYGGLTDLGQDDQHVEKRNAYAAVGDLIEVTTTSLMDLLNQHQAPTVIDYLSIDTEGSELEILKGIDWSRYQFRCITVEHNFTAQREGIKALLEGQGYQRWEAQWDDWYVNTNK